MMTTFDMLKRAHAAGLNMVITHEDTYWNDRDDTKDLTENRLYKLKTDFVLKNDMVVWRDHDHMHAMTPDYTVVGELRFGGPQRRRTHDHASRHLHHSGDDARRVGRSGETIQRRARPSLRGRPEGEGEQDPGRAPATRPRV